MYIARHTTWFRCTQGIDHYWLNSGQGRSTSTQGFPLDFVSHQKFLQPWQTHCSDPSKPGGDMSGTLPGRLHHHGATSLRRVLAELGNYVVSQRLGIPISFEKCAGPSRQLSFLFSSWTQSQWWSGCQKKSCSALHCMFLVKKWMGKAYQKRDQESLLGHLQHAATVVCPGRTFVRILIELLSAFQNRE